MSTCRSGASWRPTKKAGRYDDTVWVITSDHAMTPFAQTIEQPVIDKLLVEARNFSNVGAHVYLMEQAADTAGG